jgi:hypothetical protein
MRQAITLVLLTTLLRCFLAGWCARNSGKDWSHCWVRKTAETPLTVSGVCKFTWAGTNCRSCATLQQRPRRIAENFDVGGRLASLGAGMNQSGPGVPAWRNAVFMMPSQGGYRGHRLTVLCIDRESLPQPPGRSGSGRRCLFLCRYLAPAPLPCGRNRGSSPYGVRAVWRRSPEHVWKPAVARPPHGPFVWLYPDSLKVREKFLAFRGLMDSAGA